MEVKVQLKETAQPLEYNNVKNTYTKGNLFCVYLYTDMVHKIPLSDIFRVVEDYGYHGKREKDMGPSCTKAKAPLHGHPTIDVATKVYAYPTEPSTLKEKYPGESMCMGDNGIREDLKGFTVVPPHPSEEMEVIEPGSYYDPAGVLRSTKGK